MAARTALSDGSVLPDEGATFIRMAIRAEFEGRARAQQWIGRGPVCLMAIVTVELAFEEWHMGALSKLDPLLRMAAETGPFDARFTQQTRRGDLAHWIVTITAGEIF